MKEIFLYKDAYRDELEYYVKPKEYKSGRQQRTERRKKQRKIKTPRY